MKPHIVRILALSTALVLPVLALQEDSSPPNFSTAQLNRIFAPIALYPDALIALILPAATVPSDVVLAARYLGAQGDVAAVEDQPWDDSVKALVHFPEVIKSMEGNLPWTRQIAAAFLEQPEEAIQAVQYLRSEARSAGTLVDTPQQLVRVEDQFISIVPTQAGLLHVPRYNPADMFTRQPGPATESVVTFSEGYPVVAWFGDEFDWRQRRVSANGPWERDRYWKERRNWRRPALLGKARSGPLSLAPEGATVPHSPAPSP